MTTDRTPGPVPESPLERLLRAELEQGLVLAADPRNAGLPELARRVTTLSSPWFAALYKVCRHKFRESDRVRLCPQCGTSYHDQTRVRSCLLLLPKLMSGAVDVSRIQLPN